MHVSCLLRDNDPVGKCFPRLFKPPEARKELAELEVSRRVIGIGFEELVKVASGGIIIPQLHAFERQAVPREGIGRLWALVHLDRGTSSQRGQPHLVPVVGGLRARER